LVARHFLKPFIIITLVFSVLFCIWKFFIDTSNRREVVNVYFFDKTIPKEVIKQFEQETGIKVVFDVFDCGETLETKLFAGRSGYDVVLQTCPPYAARYLAMGICMPLDYKLLPEVRGIDPVALKNLKTVDEFLDPGFKHIVPYFFGTVGVAFNYDTVRKILPGVPLDSLDILFNPENLKKLAPYGVSLFEEPIDLIPEILRYLGKEPNSDSLEDLKLACKHLEKMKPYIKRFGGSRFVNDLIMEDVCITQAYAGEIASAIEEAKEIGMEIRFITPKEGTAIFIDCLAIPKDAPNPVNAHKFINFMYRPDIAAKVTNLNCLATAAARSLPLIKKEMLENKAIYPDKELLEKSTMCQLPPGKKTEEYERYRNLWVSKVRVKSVSISDK